MKTEACSSPNGWVLPKLLTGEQWLWYKKKYFDGDYAWWYGAALSGDRIGVERMEFVANQTALKRLRS